MTKIKKITIAEVEYVAFSMAKKFMDWNEPIPEFGTRYANVLESCLNAPFSTFARKDLYRGLIGKASILFYFMVKNHPFKNGNKRIAVMSLLYFLSKNGHWLKISNEELYAFAKQVAESRAKSKEATVLTIRGFLGAYFIKNKIVK